MTFGICCGIFFLLGFIGAITDDGSNSYYGSYYDYYDYDSYYYNNKTEYNAYYATCYTNAESEYSYELGYTYSVGTCDNLEICEKVTHNKYTFETEKCQPY